MLQFKKSSDPDFLNYKHIEHLLNLLLNEQRNQRLDLSVINSLLKTSNRDRNLQKQVDQYFEDDETSPQTDLEDK